MSQDELHAHFARIKKLAELGLQVNDPRHGLQLMKEISLSTAFSVIS